MALHIVSCSPEQTPIFDAAFKLATADDAILLVGNAVYAAAKQNLNQPALSQNPCPIYVLQDDAISRGVTAAGANQDVTFIGYEQWIDLVAEQQQSVSWFE